MAPRISIRGSNTPPSPIRKLASLAVAAKERGIRVLPLNIGQPDLPSPDQFWDALNCVPQGVLAYEQSQGNSQLCEAWAHFMARSIGLSVPRDQFLITSGASEALIFAFMVCCDTGAEILVPDPTYANYCGFAAISGIKLVPVPCQAESGYSLPERKFFENLCTASTRAILLCNPNNPTGTIYSTSELASISELCKERGLFLIVDETYREILFEGISPCSVLGMEPGAQHIVVVDSLSKRFSLCGARIGCFLTANPEVMRAASALAQARLAAGTLEQLAASQMLRSIGVDHLVTVRGIYEARRNALCNALLQIPKLRFVKPAGAFYLVVDLPVKSSEAFARYMLQEFSSSGETIFVAPAAGFFLTPGGGTSSVRLAYVRDIPELVRAAEILGEGLGSYRD